ncbi:MAG: thermonuclease family protein [Pyrinomonadaceae bacterium]
MPKKTIFLFLAIFLTVGAFGVHSQNNSNVSRSTQTDEQKVPVVIPSERIDEDISLIQGNVIVVYDGDTISLQNEENKIFTIRLQGIDAPEGKQSFGKDSKEKLANLILGKNVIVVIDKRDIYDRYIGNVYYQGQDIGLLQIKAGMAWHFKRYQEDQTAQNRKKYAQAEQEAHDARVGLWEVKDPTPPWDFRGEKNNNSKEASRKDDKSEKKKNSDGREYIRGPKGGCYYLSDSGRKVYVKDKSLCDN